MIHKHSHIHDHNHKVTVNEHRAPTDKSVELLNEFQRKAQENIIAQARVETNSLTGHCILFTEDFCQQDMIFMLKFDLNGTTHTFKTSFRKRDFIQKFMSVPDIIKHKLIVKFIHQKFAETIALELLKSNPEFISSIKMF